ncbi:MAG TPA: hypothetical protein QF353_05790 [Gammaproteobacteria bacterium]|nr:hypothetical protein [Gammaproteobacteria bacterium]
MLYRIFMNHETKGHYTFLLMSFLMCSFIVGLINFSSYGASQLFEVAKSTELGANLVLSSQEGVPQTWVDLADQYQMRSLKTVRFNGMLQAKEDFSLVSISAVTEGYPMIGRLALCSNQGCVESVQPGEVWCDESLMLHLGLIENQTVYLGKTQMIVKGFIKQAPNLGVDGWSLAPRVIIHLEDVKSMGIIGLGSRARYYLHLTGTNVDSLIKSMPPLKVSERIYSPGDLTRQGQLISQMSQYFNLIGWLGLFMVAWMIRSAVAYWYQVFGPTFAILRCLGVPPYRWVKEISIHFLPRVVISVMFGLFMAFLICFVVSHGFGFTGLLRGMVEVGSHLFILLLLWLILMFFVGYLSMGQNRVKLAGAILAGVMFVIIAFLQNIAASAMVLVVMGVVLLYLFCRLIVLLLIKLTQKLYWVKPLSYWLSGRLLKYRSQVTIQTLSLSTVIACAIVIGSLGLTMLDQWRLSLPENTPNYFAINLTADEVVSARARLKAHGVNSEWDSVVRSKIIKVNGHEVDEYFEESIRQDESLNRELNVTDIGFTQDGELGLSGSIAASIEEGLAKRLKLRLGDQVTMEAQGKSYLIEIVQVRQVKWDSFKPNYYFILQKNSLNGFQKKYISSFYIKDIDRGYLVDFIQHYPGVTLIDVDQYIHLTKRWIDYATYSIQFLLILFLTMSMLLLVQVQGYQHFQRLQDIKQLYLLGLPWDQCRSYYSVDVRWQMRVAGWLAILMGLGGLEALTQGWFGMGSIISVERIIVLGVSIEFMSRLVARLAKP